MQPITLLNTFKENFFPKEFILKLEDGDLICNAVTTIDKYDFYRERDILYPIMKSNPTIAELYGLLNSFDALVIYNDSIYFCERIKDTEDYSVVCVFEKYLNNMSTPKRRWWEK